MGSVTVVHDAVRGIIETHEWSGPYIDFLEVEFPDGFKGKPCFTTMDGARVETEDFEFEVSDHEVVLAFAPEGLEAGTIALILAAISVAISVALVLLAPKPQSLADQDSAGSVYSVGAQANRAKLGAVVPYCPGEVIRTPEYASESYRIFDNNGETRFFLLCVGGGDYEVEDVLLGSTSVSEMTPGIVEWKAYTPAQHGQLIGTIGADFGLHENVATSIEIDNQELVERKKFQSRADASVSGSTMTVANEIASLAQAGDLLVLERSPANGTYTVASSTGTTITVVGVFSANFSTRDIDLAIIAEDSRIIGPVVCNPKGSTTSRIEVDVEFPQGLGNRDDDGRLVDWSVSIEIGLTPIDDDGTAVGAEIVRFATYSAATLTPQRRTLSISVPAGRYEFRAQRNDFQNVDREFDRTLITGLKAYLDTDAGTLAYGETTIVAIKINAAEELSSSAQTRIRLKSKAVIPRLDTGEAETTNNLADVFADIVRNSAYGAGETDGIDEAALLTWRAEQAARSGFNGVFDKPITVWEALKTVALLGRAQPVPRGNTLGLAVDGPRNVRTSIVQPDSVAAGSASMQIDFLKPGDNDGIEIEYRTSDDFKEAYTRFPEDCINPRRSLVIGLTDDDEADSLAEYIWRQKLLRNERFTFDTELLGLTFDLYDRIGFAFPNFDMGDGAIVIEQNGPDLVVSRDVLQGNIFCIFRSPDGRASNIIAAVSDGRKIYLDSLPSFPLVDETNAMPVVCIVASAEADIEDITITSIKPNGKSARIEAVNYVPSLWEGLA